MLTTTCAEADAQWQLDLTTWRHMLSQELLALPARIRDPHRLGIQQNLTLSIRTIDFGLLVLEHTGYDLTTLRLGELMCEAGYKPVDSGTLPWLGSLPEVKKRLAKGHDDNI